MAARGVSFKVALNDAIRESISTPVDTFFSTETFDLGVPKRDLTKAVQQAGDLEDLELAGGLSQER